VDFHKAYRLTEPVNGNLLESKIPTPIAKNTTRGTNLYGWFVLSVNPVKSGVVKRIFNCRY